MEHLINSAIEYVTSVFAEDFSGHDAAHTMRVYRTATKLAQEEGADVLTVQLAALLHDVDDIKLSPETHENKDRAVEFLRSHGIDSEQTALICEIIDEVSFRGADSVVPRTLEGKCVQDADRLDALGAIGAARAFAFGGSRGRVMHDPEVPPAMDMNAQQYHQHESTTINHFYEKLFLLPEMMSTPSAKRIAQYRAEYMRGFVEEFLAEWDGIK